MNIEDIKVGETYNVRVKVTDLMDDKIITSTVSDKGAPLNKSHTIFFDDEAPAFSHVPYPAPIAFFKSTVIPEVYPKYDPCRKFRSGDIVTPKERNGRIPWGKDTKLIVVDNERMAGVHVRNEETGEEHFICALFLELVTPVEEKEPYHINEIFDIDDGNLIGYEVAHGDTRESIFYGGETHLRTIAKAKAAAEAERDRLNAEYRKGRND